MDQIKQSIKIIVGGGLGLFLFYLATRLGRDAGASPWLTGVVTVSIISLFVAGHGFRQPDSNRRKQAILVFFGLACLSAAGIVNEYIEHFFTPYWAHVLLAVLPGVLFAAYRGFLERRANESEENDPRNVDKHK